MKPIQDHYGVEDQREMSFSAGRSIGLLEAAIRILDNQCIDLHVRFYAACELQCGPRFSLPFQVAMSQGVDALDEPEGQVTKADVAKLHERLLRSANQCFMDFCDHFAAG